MTRADLLWFTGPLGRRRSETDEVIAVDALRRAALPPSLRPASSLRRRAAAVLTAAGLLALSWERLANVPLGSYNVKPAVLLLSLAALLVADRWAARMRTAVRARGAARWLVVVAGLTVACFVVRAVLTQPIGPSVAQVAAVLTGAVLPALAVLGALETAEDLCWALRWMIAGAVVASAFGLYQLLAFYTGLPQGIDYTGVGTSGSGGRIPAFSYEPAYFAYFLLLAIGALLTLARLEGRQVQGWTLLFFSAVLALVNVRALLFLLPVAVLLLAVAWRAHRRFLLRATLAGVAGSVLALALPLGVAAVVSATASPASSQNPVGASTAPEDQTDPVDDGGLGDDPAEPVRGDVPAPPRLPTDVLNPNEASSNGPRLDLYRAVLAVDAAHPVVGVGPGRLKAELAANGYVAPNQGATVVANNIWLQAAADGGLILLLLEAAVVAATAVLWWRRRRAPEQALLSTWLAVVLVGGMLTSYFFDIKVWVVLALALGLALTRPVQRETASA